MNGIEVASQIKKLNIPLIFITTHVNELTLEKAMDTEPYGYLIKPYDETKLRLSIEHALHRKKIQDKGSQEISLTKAINRVLQESLTSTSAHGVAKICIEVAEELTGSSLGFIGEINPAGRFDTLAVSDPIWVHV
jgi:two-component SAPR family response regulator